MAPEEKMQNNVPEEPKTEVIDEPNKMSKKSIIGMTILTIIALVGVAFGIWGIKEKNSIEKSIASGNVVVDGSTVDCVTEKTINDDEETIDIAEKNVVNANEYIYVGEWGIKIKLPEGLKTVSYKFAYGAGYTKLVLWGADCSEGQCQYFPDFADADKNVSGLGMVVRYSKGTELSPASKPEYVFSDDEYDYYYAHVQAVYSTDQSEIDHEVETVELVTEMLSNSENYSEI